MILNNVGDQPITDQIKRLEEALGNSKEDLWLELELSRLYLVNEQYATARFLTYKILNQAEIQKNNKLIAACMSNLGIINLTEKNYGKAKKWLSSALQICESLEQPLMLGQICYHLALAVWAEGEPQQAINLLERSASLQDESPAVFETLANAYEEFGEDEKSLAYHHYAQGLTLEMAQDYSNAIPEFQAAIGAGLFNSEVFRRLGICLSEIEHYEKAVLALRKSIEIDKTSVFSHADLAFLYHKLGMEQMAAREYEKSVNLAPQIAKFYNNLVDTYLRLDQVETAQKWIERALEIDNMDPTSHWLYGRICLKMGKLHDCHIAWQNGLRLAPKGDIRNTIESDLSKLKDMVAPSTIEQRSAAIEAWSKLPNRRENLEPEVIIACLEGVCSIDPYIIDAQLQLAQVYIDVGRANNAREIYVRIIKEQPENQEAYLGLGIILIALGEPEEAENILNRANTLAPKTEAGKSARWHLAILDAKKRFGDLPAQKFEEATNLFKRGDGDLQRIINMMIEVVAMAPEIGLFHFELGWMYLLSEQLDNATRQFSLAIEAQLEEGRFYGGLGAALLKTGKVNEALPVLLKAVDLDPSDPESHNALGMCFLALDDLLQAETEFRIVTGLDPYMRDGWDHLRDVLFKQNLVGQVGTELRRLLHIAPDADFAEEAEQLLSKILEVVDDLLMRHEIPVNIPEKAKLRLSESVALLCQQGRFLELSGFIDSAVEKFQEAIAEDFSAFDPHYLLANTYARKHQYQEAIKEFSFAISLDASESEIADAYYNMGNNHRELNDLDQAIIACRMAIEIYPDILDAREVIGNCLAAQEKYEEAIQILREELNLRSQQANSQISHIHLKLGQLLSFIKKDVEALFEFRKGMVGGLDLGWNRIVIGNILASRGFLNLAQEEYEKALELEPDNDLARFHVKAIRFVEYEFPWLSMADDPRVQHSLIFRKDRILNNQPNISPIIQLVHLENGTYEKRRVSLD